ncbi:MULTISPECIES: hypothetical protein [unclassified Cyanobium]|uniref:hypothetical protein n=1 Tax=unclassified Cyanobium TaxID=2627006 RepID=UPI0020CD938B|nr:MULTISPECIES: hypothetical protein [unclassified Cyanobium]MCP9777684.1 hypothetical protein [Cyanobium sp. Tous-M-B4]MCP9875414.1 hypothetical protein [Cyanobium sp. A2C-AMD]
MKQKDGHCVNQATKISTFHTLKNRGNAFGLVTIETAETAWGGKSRAKPIGVSRSAYQASRPIGFPLSSILLHSVKTSRMCKNHGLPKMQLPPTHQGGRSKQMLIYSGCSHPRDLSFDQLAFQWSQLSTLMFVLMVARGAVFHTLVSDIVSSMSTPLDRESQIEKIN